MTNWALQAEPVELNFGHGRKNTFRVVLHPRHLNQLIYDACAQAHRMYELLLLKRPGDLLEYFAVVVEESTPRIDEFIDRYAPQKPSAIKSTESKPRIVPFLVFNRFFCWRDDDTEPEEEAWLIFIQSKRFENLLKGWFSLILQAQSRLAAGDELQRHCLYQVRYANHPLDRLDRRKSIGISRNANPAPSEDSPFLRKIAELVRLDDVKSVTTYCVSYPVLRVLCNEQRRRTNLFGRPAYQSFPINVSNSLTPVNSEGWDASIRYYDEGMGRGDLFIAHPGFANHKEEPVNLDYILKSARYVLCSLSLGSIEGYEPEEGDGWFLYRLQDLSLAIAARELEDRRNYHWFINLEV